MEKRRVRADRGRLWTKVQSQPGPGQGLRGQGGMEGGSMARVHVCIHSGVQACNGSHANVPLEPWKKRGDKHSVSAAPLTFLREDSMLAASISFSLRLS